MSEVIMLCGISGSGKTTYAGKYEKMDYIKLSIDEMMYDLFKFNYTHEQYAELANKTEDILKGKLISLLEGNINVVIDMTFCKKSKRDEYRKIITENNGTYKLVFFKASLNTLKDRIKKRNKHIGSEAYYVSMHLLENYYKGFEVPTEDEHPIIIDQDKYLICVDLDSTFINSNQEISEFAKHYVKKLEAMGHHLVINTGRPMQSAVNFLKRLEIDEPVIVNNGGSIVFFDENYEKIKENFTFKMNVDILKEFLDKVKGYLKNASMSSTYDFYGYDIERLPWWVVHPSDMVHFHSGDISSNLVSEPFRGELYVKDEFIGDFCKVMEEYRKYFRFLYWGNYNDIHTYEIASYEGGKGNAMLYLADYLHISPLNTISFGDQLNDLDMLVKAKIGVAMCNSNAKLFDTVKNITEYDNNHDGVIFYLDKIFKIL